MIQPLLYVMICFYEVITFYYMLFLWALIKCLSVSKSAVRSGNAELARNKKVVKSYSAVLTQ